ncbi:MAG: hypothetical protein FD175_1962 [Beijerinckiaceae bacterium]|nr:MAG: hypothetical protein FD175_1962 [Beijerinckiaceae bacterium]
MQSTIQSPMPEAGSLHRALHRLSTGVSLVTVLVIALAVFGGGYLLLFPRQAAGYLGVGPDQIHLVGGLGGIRLRLLLALAPGIALVVLVALKVRTLFGRFSRGVILDQTNARLMSVIGHLIIAGGVVSALERTFLVLALTLGNPPGQKHLAISLSVNDFIIALFGLFVLAFGHVISEGARIADENRGFV